jgi:integrase
MSRIIPAAEKQGGPHQLGGWQDLARRRYQKGHLRVRGRRNSVWELLWRDDYIKADGSLGRRQTSRVLGLQRNMTRRQARKAADELLHPLNQGKRLPQSTMTFREFVENYFVPQIFPTLKISTQKFYRQTINVHLLPAFGRMGLCDIRTLDLQRFVLQKQQKGLSWSFVSHFRSVMSKIFTTAKKWGFFSGENPAAGVELPEKKAVREKNILEPVIIPQLLKVLEEPARTMVHLALLTGMRVGEILGLRWKDVDFRSGSIRIEQNNYRGVIGSPKTKASRRSVHLPDALRETLQALHACCTVKQPDALVFQTAKGTPYSDTNLLHRDLKPTGKKLGIPWLNWHALRRTHATLFQVVGGSLRDAQAQLGHSDATTTLESYTLPIPAHQRETVEKLSVLLTNVDESASGERIVPMFTERIQ